MSRELDEAMNEIERDDKLIAEAGKLSTEISPGRDLWPGIEQAINAPQRSRWTPRFAQAATVLLLVGASSMVTWLATKDQVQVVEVVPAGLVFEQASFGGRYALGVGYQEAHRDLQAQLDTELERLSPEARRGAIGQINKALAEEPDNPLLQELLLQTYREELAMMQRVGGLTQHVMSRKDI
jgi:hypothetical protein